MSTTISDVMIVRLLALAMLSLIFAAPHPSSADPISSNGRAFTLLSWNVNCTRHDFDALITKIEYADADLVLLQESGAPFQRRLEEHFASHYAYRLHTGTDFDGFSALSRFPIRDGRHLRTPYGAFGAYVLTIELPGESTRVMDIHLRPPGTVFIDGYLAVPRHFAAISAEQALEIGEHLKGVDARSPWILAGDFNNFAASEHVRKVIEAGFADAGSAPSPMNTWYGVFSGIELGFRIDYVFTSPHFAVSGLTVGDRRPSDHCPIVASLARVK